MEDSWKVGCEEKIKMGREERVNRLPCLDTQSGPMLSISM